jgi:hypothetical protein
MSDTKIDAQARANNRLAQEIERLIAARERLRTEKAELEAATIERCAQVANLWKPPIGPDIAAAIRALAKETT